MRLGWADPRPPDRQKAATVPDLARAVPEPGGALAADLAARARRPAADGHADSVRTGRAYVRTMKQGGYA